MQSLFDDFAVFLLLFVFLPLQGGNFYEFCPQNNGGAKHLQNLLK